MPYAVTDGLGIRHVTKYHLFAGKLIRAVADVSLTVDRGEIVVLSGPSGSGKTTLLMLAAGFLSPDDGSISFGGVELTALAGDALTTFQRENVGYLSQRFDLIRGVPALENAAMPLVAAGRRMREARRRTSRLLDRMGLGDRLDHTPERLSDGERQRVALARALINEPTLLLADEPTGNLDTRHAEEMLRLLAETSRERDMSVLLATHDPATIAIADRVVSLHDRRLLSREPKPVR